MILLFTFDPLPGKNSVEFAVDATEDITDGNGLIAAQVIHLKSGIKGQLVAALVVACDCFVWGKKRSHYTAFDMNTIPPTLLRRDFALADLRQHGAQLPEFYFDELGNLRGNNDELVMAGPRSNL